MNYFLSTEYIEQPGSIQLISLGIVAEDGRTFYAENISFDERMADDWVHKNFLSKLKWWPHRAPFKSVVDLKHFEVYGHQIWIKDAILEFIGKDISPEFWGYYAGYDWVLFCWIFGKMVDLPADWPKYCRDMKQTLDESGKDKIPDPKSGHNALVYAQWNKDLYDHLMK